MTGITALIIFAVLSLALMLIYVNHRVARMLTGRPANSWTRGSDEPVPGFFKRAHDAHMNVVENLPVFGALVLAAVATDQQAVVDQFALWIVGARVLQILMHLISTSPMFVVLRATFFSVQVVLWLYIAYLLLT